MLLSDKFTVERGSVYITGIQALVRLPIDQMRRDVLLRTTLGDITVQMEPNLAPEHVRNFLKLVESGWYDHTAFHRIVPGFVIQGGVAQTRVTLRCRRLTRPPPWPFVG